MNRRWLGVGLLTVVVGAAGFVYYKKRGGSAALVGQVVSNAAGPRKAQPIEVAEAIYDGGLKPGWDDWGWGPHELGTGPARISFQGFGGILLHHAELSVAYGGFSFRYRAPEAFGDFLHVSLRWGGAPDDAFPVVPVESRHVLTLPDGAKEVLVDWKELNPDGRPFDRVMIGSRSQVGADWVELDKVVLTKPGTDAEQKTKREGTLRVVCDGETKPISDWIYGGSMADWESGQSSQRMGGNPHSRLNWEIGAWNTGNDWFYENVGHDPTMFDVMRDAAKDKRKLAFVVPMTGWVAKDKTSVGFPRDKFPKQRKFDQYRQEAGDGFTPDDKPIEPGSPEQTSMPAPPELIGGWVKRAVAADGRGADAALQMFILDNEPTLWNTSHRDIHPKPVSYDELIERTIQYASAVREAAPNAMLAGPGEWGWIGYHGSAVDREAGGGNAPDRAAHGGVPLTAWYLRRLAEHERVTGKRLLDVLDLHFYPAQKDVYGPARDAATSELRLRSTRALWDPTYRDESWINETVRLIPRMKDWVRDNYPGTKISIGEWSFGAEDHISGALATAEALGRFGQQGLDVAFHWGEMKPGMPVYWAFRAFRNFDGKGARFLSTSLPTEETDDVSLFASSEPGGRRIVLVLINRRQDSSVKASIALKGCARVGKVRRFGYDKDSAAGLVPGTAQVTSGGVSTELAPFSLAVLELELE